MAGRVGLVPFQREPADVYRALDVFVTQHPPGALRPHHRGGAGLRRTGVVSRASGAAEQLTEGEDALTLASGDAEALAGAMRQLLEDAGLRERLGHAARRTAVGRFSRERYAREILDACTACSSGAMRRPRRLVSVSHSYVVTLNRRLANEMARVGAGAGR